MHGVAGMGMAALLAASATAPAAQIPSGAKNASYIASQKYLHDGTARKRLVDDPDYGKVLETTLKNTGGTQRAEFVLHKAGSGKHMHYEFRAKYIEGLGSLINQWHQPIGDGLGPAACFVVRYGMYHFSYFQDHTRASVQCIPLDNEWHTFELDACFSSGKNGYYHIYVDGKYIWSAYGNNSKPGGSGGQFKLGTYSGDKDCRMHYAWALWKGRSGAPPRPTQTPIGVEGMPKDTAGTGGGLEVVKATASAVDKDNVPGNAVDKDLISRWSASGDNQWLLLDLGREEKITGISIAWFQGMARIDYYDLLVSVDGEHFTPVVEGGKSSGESMDLQPVTMSAVSARYVKIVGHGNSTGGNNGWNSITEVVITGPSGTSPVPDPDPEPTPKPVPVAGLLPAATDPGIQTGFFPRTDMRGRVMPFTGRAGTSPSRTAPPAVAVDLISGKIQVR